MAVVADIVRIRSFTLGLNSKGNEFVAFEMGCSEGDMPKLGEFLQTRINSRYGHIVTSFNRDYAEVVAALEHNSPLPRMMQWARKESQQRDLHVIYLGKNYFNYGAEFCREAGGVSSITYINVFECSERIVIQEALPHRNSIGGLSAVEIFDNKMVFYAKTSTVETTQDPIAGVAELTKPEGLVGFAQALKANDTEGFARLMGEATLKIYDGVNMQVTINDIAEQFLNAARNPLIKLVNANKQMADSLSMALRSRA